MNTFILWLVVAVPKQSCNDQLRAQRQAAVANLLEVSKSTDSAKLELARQQLSRVPPDLIVTKNEFDHEPKADSYGPCYEVFAEKRKLFKVK